MPVEIDTFQPEKRALGQILSSTSPPIRVPDYQRDFSWKDEQTSDFWSDLITFGGTDPQAKLIGKEYFGVMAYGDTEVAAVRKAKAIALEVLADLVETGDDVGA